MRAHLQLLTAAALLGSSVYAGDSQKPVPDLTGQWRLERDHSQLPPQRPGREGDNEKPEEGLPERPRGPMGGDGMGGGMGRRGGMGGFGMGGPGPGRFPRQSPEELAAMRDLMRSVLIPAETLQLKNEEGAISVSSAETGTIILRPDNKKVKLDGGGERRTRWNDDQLQEELKAGLLKVKRIYGVTDTERGRRLVVVVRIEDQRRGEREYWYVYQPTAPQAEASSTPAAEAAPVLSPLPD